MRVLSVVFHHILTVGVCGLVAVVLTAIIYFLLSFAWALLMIPVGILAGDSVANQWTSFVDSIGFTILYGIVFIDLLLEEYADSGVWHWIKSKRKVANAG